MPKQENQAGDILVESTFLNSLDRFFLAATPKVFEWLRWVITLAAIGYVQKKTESAAVTVVFVIAGTMLLGYFVAFAFRYRLAEPPEPKFRRTAYWITLVCSMLFGMALLVLALHSVDSIIASQK